MNGRERPCENSTANTAILLLDYAFRQEYVLTTRSGRVSRQVCSLPRQRRLVLSGVLAPKFLGRSVPRQDNGGKRKR